MQIVNVCFRLITHAQKVASSSLLLLWNILEVLLQKFSTPSIVTSFSQILVNFFSKFFCLKENEVRFTVNFIRVFNLILLVKY